VKSSRLREPFLTMLKGYGPGHTFLQPTRFSRMLVAYVVSSEKSHLVSGYCESKALTFVCQ
jgi:hypothetical protein